MENDEQEIRRLVSTWITATEAGDVETVLSLMAEDAIFLLPGRPPMGKAEFAAAARDQQGADAPRFEVSSAIQEIKILGDWAFMWQRLEVVTTTPDGAPPAKRTGHTLTIFKKLHGAWVLARDANMLAPTAE